MEESRCYPVCPHLSLGDPECVGQAGEGGGVVVNIQHGDLHPGGGSLAALVTSCHNLGI